MPQKNKIYWFERVTDKGLRALLTDENSKFKWLRLQRNRRVLQAIMPLGLALTPNASYWTSIKKRLNFKSEIAIMVLTLNPIRKAKSNV